MQLPLETLQQGWNDSSFAPALAQDVAGGALASVLRPNEVQRILAAPLFAALAGAQMKLELKDETLRLLIIGPGELDAVEGGRWYAAAGLALGAARTHVTFVGSKVQAHGTRGETLTVEVFRGKLIDFLRENPHFDCDLAVCFHAGMTTYRSLGVDGSLHQISSRGATIALTGANYDDIASDRCFLLATGFTDATPVARNPWRVAHAGAEGFGWSEQYTIFPPQNVSVSLDVTRLRLLALYEYVFNHSCMTGHFQQPFLPGKLLRKAGREYRHIFDGFIADVETGAITSVGSRSYEPRERQVSRKDLARCPKDGDDFGRSLWAAQIKRTVLMPQRFSPEDPVDWSNAEAIAASGIEESIASTVADTRQTTINSKIFSRSVRNAIEEEPEAVHEVNLRFKDDADQEQAVAMLLASHVKLPPTLLGWPALFVELTGNQLLLLASHADSIGLASACYGFDPEFRQPFSPITMSNFFPECEPFFATQLAGTGVVDIGGADGELSRRLVARGIPKAVVLDRLDYRAPRTKNVRFELRDFADFANDEAAQAKCDGFNGITSWLSSNSSIDCLLPFISRRPRLGVLIGGNASSGTPLFWMDMCARKIEAVQAFHNENGSALGIVYSDQARGDDDPILWKEFVELLLPLSILQPGPKEHKYVSLWTPFRWRNIKPFVGPMTDYYRKWVASRYQDDAISLSVCQGILETLTPEQMVACHAHIRGMQP